MNDLKVIPTTPVIFEPTSATYDVLVEKKETEIPTSQDFYIFTKSQILEATTQKYRDFLKESGYANLDSCQRLEIAKGILKKDNKYVVNINQTNARKLVEGIGYKILTTGLMYNLFIPFIKEEAEKGNEDAEETLEEMTKKAEWLEDLIIDKKKLRIKNKDIKITLPEKDGKFNREDLNELGYPKKLTDNGEFNYWFPRDNENAVIRSWSSELGLICNFEPSNSFDNLGVRQAKFFP